MPTGSGKTEIFLKLSDDFIKQNNCKVMILSHMGLLVEQTTNRAAQRVPHLSVGWLKARYRPSIYDNIIIGTMQSARIDHKINTRWDIGLIIVDEAHFITAESYKKIISMFPNAKIVGFTATPYKSRRLMTNSFEKISYSLSLQEMIQMGYLVKPRMVAVEQQSDDTVLECLRIYKAFENGRSTIMFLPSIEEAELAAKGLIADGINAGCIVGSTADKTRVRLIDGFNDGKTKVLTTVDVLTAGFDSARCQSIIMGSRSSSPTAFMQRIGRGLRPYPNKTECPVYFFGKVPTIEKKFYEEMEKFLKPKPERMTIDEKLEWAKHEEDEQTITYCQDMARIYKSLYEYNHNSLADLVRTDTLSDELLGNIKDIADRLSGIRAKDGGEATPRQLGYLKSLTGMQLECSKGEANVLIDAILSVKNPGYQEEWKVKSGLHAGKHIKDLPWAYKSWCLKNQPGGQIAELIHKWTNRNRSN